MAQVHINAKHFPNSTTLYIWHFKGASDVTPIPGIVGGIDLTRTGALTQQDNHLSAAESVFCELDGTNDYFSSTNAAFNFTGSFSVGAWFYRADWSSAPGATMDLFSRFTGNSGWLMDIKDATHQFEFLTFDGAATSSSLVSTNITGLSAGWHHLVIAREVSVATKFYIDGVIDTTDSDTSNAIAESGDMFIGARNGATNKLTGRIQDAFIHNGTVLDATQVAKVYNAFSMAGVNPVLLEGLI